MYTRYFGFSEKPFTLTPNPRFIYLSKNHKEAFAHLLYGINNHYGFIELIGEVGTGKTTVLRTLLDQLRDENYRSALIFNPCMSSVELLRAINSEFGIEVQSEHLNDLLAALNSFLLEENARGKTVVLVIDEAQNLQPDVLEQIRLISNLETQDDKLIQIILAGQPELEALLEQPGLRQLNQRIAVKYKLSSMNFEETGTYIRHRMHIAGETGGVVFTGTALRSVYLYTHGLPRLINILCDRSLLIAYGDERRTINGLTVLRAVAELVSTRRKTQLAVGVCGLACALSAAVWLALVPENTTRAATTVSTSQQVQHQLTSAAPQQSVTLASELARLDRTELQYAAVNTLLAGLNAKKVQTLDDDLSAPNVLTSIAARRRLKVTEFKGTVADVEKFGCPVILHTKQLGAAGDFHLAVTPLTGGKARISAPQTVRNPVTYNQLEALADGTFYLVWRNWANLPSALKPGERRKEIRLLQQQLKLVGVYGAAINGIYDTATVNAVLAFQQKSGLPSNEKVGELTLALLSHTKQQHTSNESNLP